MASSVENILKRIQSHKGVIGSIVVNSEGTPIRSDLDNSTTLLYASNCHHLAKLARSTVRDIDPQNDLSILRVKSRKYEIIIAPYEEYMLIVVQSDLE
ncbi:predicted protein [Nematostella vectensis]|uniref:Dynein light chain roadblock n=1 Tax=Nematostella vectensis TaxID=45351 RepID=A7RZX7_NEMVE|nr:predicted protein [Nematostella vectensis]EDO43024.1 predicted protein [Nematostella vectensis]|eukprot:XP_001621044.1 hypothetical protein NEMVEDRAFT_v1g222427 [Nematostella vectensis]